MYPTMTCILKHFHHHHNHHLLNVLLVEQWKFQEVEKKTKR